MFGANNGSVSCDTFCKGTNGVAWNNKTLGWKGAKCVDVRKRDGTKDPRFVIDCDTVRLAKYPLKEYPNTDDHICVCERDDVDTWVQ